MRISSRKRNVELKGAKEIVQTLKDMEEGATEVLEKASKAGAKIAKNEAKRLCPVRTGRLKNSIDTKKGKSDKLKSSTLVTVGKDVHYASFVELGTASKDSQPFMRPALDNNEKDINDEVARKIADNVQRKM